ncbi:MAG: HTTM domain-containing protein [Kofleriaceae bacterium]
MTATDEHPRAPASRWFAPVDGSSVALFRIAFGVLMAIATLRFFAHDWIADYFVMPRHFLTYYGFDWVKPWPGPGMYIHFGAMLVLSVMVAIGWRYRISVVVFGALFAYAHLIDKTNYLNHYYLVICLCGLMAFLPLDRVWSVAARRDDRGPWIPVWVVWALRGQIALVYVFGGIAKLKPDWLIDAQPMKIWLAANTDFPVIGPWFSEPWVAHAFSIAGAVFDLSIVPLLLWRRTRVFAYAALVVFHLVTARLFHLGMFPWIMMAASLVLLPPDWPRRLLARLRGGAGEPRASRRVPEPTPRRRRLVIATLGVYFAFHVAMPLRHWLYPGDVCWTEQGFRFAWNVMLMEKDGSVEFHVREPATGRRWEVAPTEYLTRYQAKMTATQPDMILQLAHIIADDFRARGVADPEVRVDAFASLNGRPAARLIDPAFDLARERDRLSAQPWIIPTWDQPMRRPGATTTAYRGAVP